MLRSSLAALRLCRSFHKSIIPSRVNRFKRFGITLPALGLATVVCENQLDNEPLEKLELAQVAEQLQHEFLLRQACISNTTSATQLLTTLAVAFHDTSNRLREALSEEVKLTDQLLQWGNNAPEDHFDAMIAHRVILDDLRRNVRVLTSYMEYVERLATAAAELSYISGNIIASDMICEQIEHVQRVIRQESELNNVLENQSLQLQCKVIETTKEKDEIEETPSNEIKVD